MCRAPAGGACAAACGRRWACIGRGPVVMSMSQVRARNFPCWRALLLPRGAFRVKCANTEREPKKMFRIGYPRRSRFGALHTSDHGPTVNYDAGHARANRSARRGIAEMTRAVKVRAKRGAPVAAAPAVARTLEEAERECARLKVELAAAKARIAELEAMRKQALDRVEWAIDSLHSLSTSETSTNR